MKDPGVARRDIDRDCRMLKFNLGEATRKWPLALLAEAEDRLAAGAASRSAATAIDRSALGARQMR
jgi:hypothetical protein